MPPAKKTTARKSSAKKTSAKKTSAKKTGAKTTSAKQAPSRQSQKALEDAADRIRALNEQIIDRSRAAGEAYLDAYERSLKTIAAYQDRMASAAEGSRADWLGTLLKAQAELTREIGESVSAFLRQSWR
jgi:hypothetical protein